MPFSKDSATCSAEGAGEAEAQEACLAAVEEDQAAIMEVEVDITAEGGITAVEGEEDGSRDRLRSGQVRWSSCK